MGLSAYLQIDRTRKRPGFPPLRRFLVGRAIRNLDRNVRLAADPRDFVELALRTVTKILAADAAFLLKRDGGRLHTIAAVRTFRKSSSFTAGGNVTANLLTTPVPGSAALPCVLGLQIGRKRLRAWEQRFFEAVARRVGLIVERWESSVAQERQSYFDPTTGLPNRQLLLRHLQRRLQSKSRGWLALVEARDFDRADGVSSDGNNETIIRALATRLAPERERGLWLARCDGARFAIVAPGGPKPEMLERIMDGLEREADRTGTGLRIRFHAGVARFPLDGEDAQKLVANCETALAAARQRDERVVVFQPALRDAPAEGDRLERLRHSLSSGDGIELVFQPIFDLERGEAAFAEALVRWRDAAGNDRERPDGFVALAERHGLAQELDRLVLQKALEAAATWRQRLGGMAPRITINVSPESLADPGFVDLVIRQVGRLPARQRPLLELTERRLADSDRVNAGLRRLHAAGVRVLVDDLGSGYAALSSLLALKADGFKLDRTLLAATAQDYRARAVVRTMLQLGRDLGLTAIVEGVENAAQLEWLRSQGCRYAQGYHLGRPQSAGELIDFLLAGRRHQTASGRLRLQPA